MEEFSLPEDITALNDEELDDLLDGAVKAFDAKAGSNTVTNDELAKLRELATAVNDIRAEKAERIEAAEKAAAEIEQLAASVRGDDGEEEVTASDEPEEPAEPEPAAEPEPKPVTASAVAKSRALDLSRVRVHQPRVLPKDPNPRPEITASVDVPGYQPGQPLDMEGVTEGIIRRANALKTAGGGVGLCASYRLPFDNNLIVNDSSSGTEGTRAVILAADQSRLPQGNIVASGGWCAPSETVYTLTSIACPEMLWDAPEIQLARGGLRFFKIPSLDVGSMTFVHTEADDISGAVKPCFVIPCPEPEEVRCDAVGVCLQAGILTQRHFPELVAWYQRNTMVAHELRVRQVLFEQAVNASTPVTIAQTFGAFSAIFAAVALQAADMVERHSLCDSINIEVVFPWWARNMFLADIARRNGVGCDEIDPACIVNAFATLGVRVQWARGLAPNVPAQIGGPTPAVDWPDSIPFMIHPAGAFQIGRGGEISLGVIHDSTKFQTNDYTAAFSEECVALIDRGPESRIVTVPVCPDGRTGEQLGVACPIA
ncbi:major capsid protein [Streptomyces sp. ME02-6987-2C]|uniref:major capsid protein n=1 Tax=unclassified Streptomyces TaxID=2593676 RepID=UPI0029B13870|nr:MULTISPECIES: major capsid protein [unclassified Streptomyces]MDX3345889.1 major capsid protein [Streptomyces sp. ME02-6979A]MDX3365084.1 major capsid protein [Streptomyces sp. ME02-6987-2C]MDX3404861.1 major capsid protein [Streptomyces sp. ME02-6977A]MDX3421655.1 major capsid protein [Streptomyces sp. ME02-6985-2c]